MSRFLILEDDRKRVNWFKQWLKGHRLDITFSVEKANKWLSENQYDGIFLDHDLLGIHYLTDCFDCEFTGLHTAKFLAANLTCNAGVMIIVHSMNEPGSDRMMAELKARKAYRVPFPDLQKRVKIV